MRYYYFSSRTTDIISMFGLLWLLFGPSVSPPLLCRPSSSSAPPPRTNLLLTPSAGTCGGSSSSSCYSSCCSSSSSSWTRYLGLPHVLMVSGRSLNARELLACPSSSSSSANNEGNDADGAEGRLGAWTVTFRSSRWSPSWPRSMLGQPNINSNNRNNCHPMDALVFPSATTTISPGGEPRQKQQRHRKKRRLFPTLCRYDECKLSLFSNGTFEIVPPRVDDETSSSSSSLSSSNLLAVHGKWKVQRNPYCVTDRFFDQVRLESYPRVQSTTTTTTAS
jgi:hypothetical protein